MVGALWQGCQTHTFYITDTLSHQITHQFQSTTHFCHTLEKKILTIYFKRLQKIFLILADGSFKILLFLCFELHLSPKIVISPLVLHIVMNGRIAHLLSHLYPIGLCLTSQTHKTLLLLRCYLMLKCFSHHLKMCAFSDELFFFFQGREL